MSAAGVRAAFARVRKRLFDLEPDKRRPITLPARFDPQLWAN